jgi:hypothetical protein
MFQNERRISVPNPREEFLSVPKPYFDHFPQVDTHTNPSQPSGPGIGFQKM